MRPAAHGITLVELLVTTSLMALVGTVGVASLGGGVRVWERTMTDGVQRHTVLVAFEQLRRDLQNLRRFTPIPFDGAYDQYEAAAAGREDSQSGADSQRSGPEEIGRLGYYLDERQRRLCRAFTPYRRARQQSLRDQCQTVLEDVTRMRLSYFGASADTGQAGWSDHWKADAPPQAVKCTLTLERAPRDTHSHTTVITLIGALPLTPPAEENP